MKPQQDLRATAKKVVRADLDFLTVADFKTQDLIESFSAMEANAPAIGNHIAERMVPLCKALGEQCDIIFGLISVNSVAAPSGD